MDPALINLLILGGGIVLLLGGGEWLVRGAVTMAVRFGVAPLLIGLTVVAFGTSAPELAFNLIAALRGNTELSFGNVVGSNIANVGLVLGAAALIRPMRVNASVVQRELPIMILITLFALGVALWPYPEGGLMGAGEGFGRLDGAILLGVFALFSLLTVHSARRDRMERGKAEFAGEVEEVTDRDRERPMALAVVLFLAGLGMLVAGGQLAERGAAELASVWGVSDTLIGLTIVAVATSLPELFVCVIAALRGQADIAVGNVVGSNIFNLTLILGTTASVKPVALPEGGAVALLAMTALSVLLVPMARTRGRNVSRVEGMVLISLYGAYLVYEVIAASPGG